jgi:hypothetical protein
MNDEPEFDLKVTGADIAAALERHDYGWLVDNVFLPRPWRSSSASRTPTP